MNTEHLASKSEKLALTGFQEKVIQISKKTFIEEGVHPAMVFIGIELSDSKIAYAAIPVSHFMRSIESKDALADLMKKLGKEVEPLCICLISEAWMVEAKNSEDKAEVETIKILTPSKHPDRIECLVCTFESENINRTFTYPIIRGKELSLGECKIPTQVDSVGGRWSGVLRDLKKIKQN